MLAKDSSWNTIWPSNFHSRWPLPPENEKCKSELCTPRHNVEKTTEKIFCQVYLATSLLAFTIFLPKNQKNWFQVKSQYRKILNFPRCALWMQKKILAWKIFRETNLHYDLTVWALKHDPQCVHEYQNFSAFGLLGLNIFLPFLPGLILSSTKENIEYYLGSTRPSGGDATVLMMIEQFLKDEISQKQISESLADFELLQFPNSFHVKFGWQISTLSCLLQNFTLTLCHLTII